MQKILIGRTDVPSGGASSVLFSSIPASFVGLVIFGESRSTADLGILIKFNDSSTTFESRRLQGDGSSVVSRRSTTNSVGFTNWNSSTSDVFASLKIFIPNYTSSNVKQFMVDSATEQMSGTGTYMKIEGAQWDGTSAITSIELASDSGVFAEFSSFALYGVPGGSDGTTTVS